MGSEVIAFCFFVLGSCMGQMFSKKYTRRKCFFECLKQFNDDFINELSFSKKNLYSILSKEYLSNELNMILKKKQVSLDVSFIKNMKELNLLKGEECYELDEYFLSLGRSDSETQLKILNVYQKKFDKKVKEVYEDQRKYGTLCKKTGIMVGLIAFVIAV